MENIEKLIEECIENKTNSFVVSKGAGLDLSSLKDAIEESYLFDDDVTDELGFTYDYFIDLSLPGFYTVYIIELYPGVEIY